MKKHPKSHIVNRKFPPIHPLKAALLDAELTTPAKGKLLSWIDAVRKNYPNAVCRPAEGAPFKYIVWAHTQPQPRGHITLALAVGDSLREAWYHAHLAIGGNKMVKARAESAAKKLPDTTKIKPLPKGTDAPKTS